MRGERPIYLVQQHAMDPLTINCTQPRFRNKIYSKSPNTIITISHHQLIINQGADISDDISQSQYYT